MNTAADSVDLTDDRWEVFYLFQEETAREVLGEKWRPEALVGYFTVFGFRNPVKGVSLRICQALVLPQFQRQGRGEIAFVRQECVLVLVGGVGHIPLAFRNRRVSRVVAVLHVDRAPLQ